MGGSNIVCRCLVAALIAAAALPAARAETVLRAIPQADLRSLDPVWSTAAITLMHGYLVYDQLFAMDSRFNARPEMVETYEAGADGLTHRFSLRAGLLFSDGSPVTAKDAVASIRRWGARAVAGQTLMPRIASLEPTGDLAFTMTLKEPVAPLLDMLADPVLPLFVMREKEALTDPFKQIEEIVGSGPFRFVKEEFKPGDRVVYVKSPTYKPRSEPADGYAGGKLAKVDRVEWKIVPDQAIAVAALTAGEIDVVEQPTFDLLPALARNKDVVLTVANPLGYQPMMRPNQLIPPFNNPKAREALLHLVDQQEYLTAMVGMPEYRIACRAPFICGSPSESAVGKPDLAKAKQLFKEAGYTNEPIVIMDPTDLPVLHAMSLVTADKLRQIGVTVDLQAMDWASLVGRRPTKDAPSKDARGWHLFHTTWPAMAMQNPITNSAVAAPCDGKNWFGWVCDEELEKMRLEFITATGTQRDELVKRYQTRFYETVPYILLGQYMAPIAYRKNISGVLETPRLVLWNIEKK